MSGLPNLARLVEAATPGPWQTGVQAHEFLVGKDSIIVCDPYGPNPQDEPLIAAAPNLAALLIDCEEALRDLIPWAGKQTFENDAVWVAARAALSRLAGFDAQLGDQQ